METKIIWNLANDMQKKCTICGKEFESRYGTEVCSEVCRAERKRINDTKSNARRRAHESDIPVIKNCPICGKQFETIRNKYCSKECAETARRRGIRIYDRWYHRKEK